MTLNTEQTIRRSVLVEAAQEHAFAVFTTGLSRWWPLESHHIGPAEAAEAVIEPRTGGRWFERGVDGSERDWGRVLEWEPPVRLRLAWMLGPGWEYDPDEAHATLVEVTFAAEGPSTTRVELVHSGFERVPGGEQIRSGVGGEGGWGSLLQRYAVEAASGG